MDKLAEMMLDQLVDKIPRFAGTKPDPIIESDMERKRGNQKFADNKFYLALAHYNKALVHARDDAKRTALCYANRSAVYLELKNFKHCLHNIDMAEPNYPIDKIQKLHERRQKCLRLMVDCADHAVEPLKYEFKLSYEPNPKLPFFIDALELKEDEPFGKHLITTRDLKAGDVIAVIDKPLKEINGNVTEKETRMVGCYNCMKLNNLNLIPGKCQALFCSETCRDEHEANDKDHESFHDMESKALARHYIFSARLFLKLLDAFASFEDMMKFVEEHSGKKYTVFDFDWTITDESVYNRNLLLTIMSVFIDKKPDEIESASMVIWRQFNGFVLWQNSENRFCKTYNAYKQHDAFWKKILWHIWDFYDVKRPLCLNFDAENVFGALHHPAMSLLNHSCDPNIFVHVNESKEIVWIVNRPVFAGSQIFRTYKGDDCYYAENYDEIEPCPPEKIFCLPCEESWADEIDDQEILALGVFNNMHNEFITTKDDVKNVDKYLMYLNKTYDYINDNFDIDQYLNDAEFRQTIVNRFAEIQKLLQAMENPFAPSNAFYCTTASTKEEVEAIENNLDENFGLTSKNWNKVMSKIDKMHR